MSLISKYKCVPVWISLLCCLALCACQSEPSPTIMEGTLWWDDGTPATNVYIIASSEKSSGWFNGAGGAGIADVAEFYTGNDNRFYLELAAEEDITNCRISFSPEGHDYINPAQLNCGKYRCDEFIAGKKYYWTVTLPKD